MVWDPKARQGNEAAKIRWEIVPYTRGKVLDLGPGPFKAFRHFIGVDNVTEYKGLRWTPDIRGDCEDLGIIASQSMDAVFSSHLLEHLEDPGAALKEWWRVIKQGGHLVLYLPHKDFYPNVGEEGANPDHLHDFLPRDIIALMKQIGHWDLVVSENRNEGDEYSFLQVYRKNSQPGQTYSYANEKPVKTCAVVRYGGIGDCMQASSVLPALKKQGYHITFHTTTEGYGFLKHDPHIDAWWIQDKGQINEHELRDFWEYISKKYDKWVNLTEIVEGTLLPMHLHTPFWWPRKARERLTDVNYMELSHLVADVPFDFQPAFYPSPKERKWAEKERKKIGKCILWTISGSSVHKIWPYMDVLISRIMLERPDWQVVLVGDELCRIMIETPWEEEPRVLCRSGKWSVRDTLAFAREADLVIGPETGIINSVATMDTPKLIWLSHSSIENLTKHWVNTISLVPDDCDCYPCHQLHYSFEFCKRDGQDTGTAMCQANINPEIAWHALTTLMDSRTERTTIWQETPTLITP